VLLVQVCVEWDGRRCERRGPAAPWSLGPAVADRAGPPTVLMHPLAGADGQPVDVCVSRHPPGVVGVASERPSVDVLSAPCDALSPAWWLKAKLIWVLHLRSAQPNQYIGVS
jgi:hypothetical protein